MLFAYDGVRYDSDALITLRTGDPYEPFIYMTQGHTHVFVGVMDKWTGYGVRRADAAEIPRLAARFNLPELTRALGAASPGIAPPADPPSAGESARSASIP